MGARIEIHGVPMDLGANLRGVDMGPSALRIAGIDRALRHLGYDVRDHDELGIKSRVSLSVRDESARFVDEIAMVCGRLHDIALKSMDRGSIPIFLGGDHSIAAGTVAGVSSHFRAKEEHVGLIWFDAHADMNTPETSPSGNVHGMPLSTLLGYGSEALLKVGGQPVKVRPENVFIVGARDVDENEKKIVQKAGVTVFSMKEIDLLGMAE
ncbi:MAG: arginase, partial [Planctomycetes bacterium]|nr:arginase [Planctomycetota bacterium]